MLEPKGTPELLGDQRGLLKGKGAAWEGGRGGYVRCSILDRIGRGGADNALLI